MVLPTSSNNLCVHGGKQAWFLLKVYTKAQRLSFRESMLASGHDDGRRALPTPNLLWFLSLSSSLTPQRFDDLAHVLMKREGEKRRNDFLSTLATRREETSVCALGRNYSFLAGSATPPPASFPSAHDVVACVV